MNLESHLSQISNNSLLMRTHINYLNKLDIEGFQPNVCYDIGACVLHWTRGAQNIWPNAEYVLFDAFEPAEFLYKPFKHFTGVLSNVDGKEVKFYQNNIIPQGNSYYKEATEFFPTSQFIMKKTRTLDSVVSDMNLPKPDLIKIDVQGSEIDVINGAINTIKHAKYLIVELQHTQYNEGAPMADFSIPYIESLGWKCIKERFSDNGPDADYCFINTNY
jgi:FkbM family methyltransferase